jgi:hypothetical protein
MEYIDNMPKKLDKKILDEIDKCWDEYQQEIDTGQIQLEDLLKRDPKVFESNIKWIGNEKGMYPYHYANINDSEKILVNFPYQEINIKAYRNGELFYINQALNTIN